MAGHTGAGFALCDFGSARVHYGVSHQNPPNIFSRYGVAHTTPPPDLAGTRADPSRAPLVDGLDLYGECRPARDAGGDFFEFAPLHPAGLSVSVGDLSGEGAGGAIVMSGLKAMLRALTRHGSYEIGRLVRELNHAVWLTAPDDFSATLFCAYLDPVLGELQYVNAGHEPALLIRRRTGRVHHLESTGTLLGLSNRVIHGQRTVPLEPGDLLIVYTDGVVDARNAAGAEFRETGILRVLEEFREVRASDLTREILDAVERHSGRERQSDDRTVVVARFKGSAALTETAAAEELALAAA